MYSRYSKNQSQNSVLSDSRSEMMPDILILVGLLAIVVERGIEPFMNFVKASWGKPEEGQNPKQIAYRVTAFLVAIILGLLITRLFGIDLVKEMLPTSRVENGWILTGIIIGLGSAPAHEVINYIEQKKNKAKEERKLPEGAVQDFDGLLSRSNEEDLRSRSLG
jgi:hypothetical protein